MNRLQTQEKKKLGCLPLARGDESGHMESERTKAVFAPRKRGWIACGRPVLINKMVCPSQEGMNHSNIWGNAYMRSLPLARGDESCWRGSFGVLWIFAPRRRGWIWLCLVVWLVWNVCPSQEVMNHPSPCRPGRWVGLPLAWGDESYTGDLGLLLYVSAPRKRWWICKKRFNGVDIDGLPLARGDESHGCCGYIFRSSPASRMRGWIARGYLWPEKYTVQLSASRKRGCFYFC